MEEVCMIIPSDKPTEYNYILESNETGKLSDILSRRYGFSTRILRNIKRGGILEVNGAPARVISSAVAGDKVRIVLPREKLDADPVDSPFDIIYEDSEILAVNKSPGVVSHPTKRHQLDTLANYAAAYAALRGDSYKLRFVNRLDMDTSGVIIIAKNKFVHHYIQSRMQGPDVEKTYTVWAEEAPDRLFPDSGTIDLPIGRPDPVSIRRCVMEDGQRAVTHYKVLERVPGAVRLEIVLETGRTHQIRVHLAAAEHPIIGDPLYNPDSCERFGLNRQALHASRLKLPLPKAGILELQAELPDDFIQLENRLRGKI